MDSSNELELTRRGFTVLAASAFGAFLSNPASPMPSPLVKRTS